MTPGSETGSGSCCNSCPKLPEEDWDQELTFPSHPLDWEQAVSQAAAMEGNGADVVGDNQVKMWGDETTAGAVHETDARGDSQVKA